MWIASGERISGKRIGTAADRVVVDHLAASAHTTSAITRIGALKPVTGFGCWTFGANGTLWLADRWRTRVLW